MGTCYQFKQSQSNKTSSDYKSFKQQLTIKSYTWAKESYGLFDYENKNAIIKTFQLCKSGTISVQGQIKRSGDDVYLSQTPVKENESDKKLLSFEFRFLTKNNHFWINHMFAPKQIISQFNDSISSTLGNEDRNEYKPWIVVKFFQNQNKYKLMAGDVIKLGRMKLKIKRINFGSQKDYDNIKTLTTHGGQVLSSSPLSSDHKKEVMQCRICLSSFDPTEKDNPFLTPCKCSGSVKYVHHQCLLWWLNGKMMKKNNGDCCETLIWKIHRCEICKGKFPNYIRSNGVIYDLFQIPKQNGPFIELEVVKRDIKSPKIIHIINFNSKSTIQIGRGNDNDFKISDISVSRLHATFTRSEDKELYIQDNNSKFGTLVKLRSPLILNFTENQNNTAIQVGRTYIEFTVNKGLNQVFDSCCNKQNLASNYYEQQIQNIEILDEYILQNDDIGLDQIEFEEEDYEPDDNNSENDQGQQQSDVEQNQGDNEQNQNLELPNQQNEQLNTDLYENH